MNRYGKLALIELHRFWKVYAALLAMTLVSQAGGFFYHLRTYMNGVHRQMAERGFRTYQEYREVFRGGETFHSFVSFAEPWFSGPVVLCAAAMIFYVFFIWYRDWLGKNTFIYRLLMLPTERLNLFWAKLTAIMAFVLGLVAFQIVLLPVHLWMFRQIIPPELGISESIFAFVRNHRLFQILIPGTFPGFLVSYGTGLMSVTVVFASVLIERSFRLKGLFGAILYAAACGTAMLAPSFSDRLYPLELFWLRFGIGILLLAVSVALSWLLLKRKITV
ncbi:hypothetical protein [Cohnella caldifontis]|uniref:hypothetical protein n=1 Tax=Cohnella caldifontis TaxID=3027471 RepID=UPI0023EA91D6|nr:hypothetical protein [Cohnella sp. YIM B05605]